MDSLLPRLSANAAIVKNGRILLVEFDDESGLHYNLPGGGIEPGESIPAGLRREIREETCAEARVGRLLIVHEYYPPHHDTKKYGTRHKVGLIFACTLLPGSEPRLPRAPDPNQTAVRWVPLADLPNTPLLPRVARELIAALNENAARDPFMRSV